MIIIILIFFIFFFFCHSVSFTVKHILTRRFSVYLRGVFILVFQCQCLINFQQVNTENPKCIWLNLITRKKPLNALPCQFLYYNNIKMILHCNFSDTPPPIFHKEKRVYKKNIANIKWLLKKIITKKKEQVPCALPIMKKY